MSVTIQGTYTQDNGTQPAAGTVVVTPLGGSPDTETLDDTGSFSHAYAYAEHYDVVESVGSIVRQRTIKALDGKTVDLSRDTGDGATTGLQIGSIKVTEVTGAPAIAGELGDLAVRKDGSGAKNNIYACTTAGSGSHAVWTAIA
jgi:hypothetical protein